MVELPIQNGLSVFYRSVRDIVSPFREILWITKKIFGIKTS